MNKIFIIAALFIVALLSGCLQQPQEQQLDPKVCVYNEIGQLTCGSSWKVLHEGILDDLEANTPLDLPKEKLIALQNPENPEEVYLLYTTPGTYEVNEKTSAEAMSKKVFQQ